MKLPRRTFLHLAVGATVFPAASRAARVQAYPMHPARILSGFPPGGISDTYARLIAQWLSEYLGQHCRREQAGRGRQYCRRNRRAIDARRLHVAAPTSADAWNATLYNNLNFNIVRDFVPVATISRGPRRAGRQSVGSGTIPLPN